MSADNAKLMALYPHKGNFRAPNVATPFYFHVPGEYDVDTGDAIVSDNNVVNMGQVATPLGSNLRQVSWSSQFITHDDYMLYYGIDRDVSSDFPLFVKSPPRGFVFDDAFSSIDLLETMKRNGEVARLIIRDELMDESDIDMPVILLSFKWHEKGGEPDVRYYDITFQEYRPLTIRQVPRAGSPPPGTTARPDNYGRFLPANYALPKEMGLVELCQAAYHHSGTTIRGRVVRANGGTAWLHKVGAVYRPTDRGGPWFLPKGTKVYLPPYKGALHPKQVKSTEDSRLAADEG